MLIGEDMQLAWQLHMIRPDGARYWQVGDSPHRIPGMQGLILKEVFIARWAPATKAPLPEYPKRESPAEKSHPKEGRSQWNAVAKYQLMILPEAIATIMAMSQRAPKEGALYLEGISLK